MTKPMENKLIKLDSGNLIVLDKVAWIGNEWAEEAQGNKAKAYLSLGIAEDYDFMITKNDRERIIAAMGVIEDE